MAKIICDINYLDSFVTKDELLNYAPKIKTLHQKLLAGDVAGNDMLGWHSLPKDYDKEEFNRIKEVADTIQKNSQVFILVGIGGSYLGARAAIEALKPNFGPASNSPEILYAGHNLSGSYLSELLDYIKDKDVSLNVISKSGTTTEPAVAFRFLRQFMEKKYGEEAKKRIFITTDKNKGALKELAEKDGYSQFVVPDNIGGRYSVLSAVGLLPIAVAGIDIDQLLEGAMEGYEEFSSENLSDNAAYQYASLRNILYKKGKKIEILANYEPNLHYLGEWWKQLFGESEGKDSKGIFPASALFTTDLHSLGQCIQDGERHLFETVLDFNNESSNIVIKAEENNLDELNYLDGKSMDYINKQALLATVTAHTEGGVPNIVLKVDSLNPKSLGKLIYFFEKACMMSSYLLDVNPFNQPGVEVYKKNMFHLLGKKGY